MKNEHLPIFIFLILSILGCNLSNMEPTVAPSPTVGSPSTSAAATATFTPLPPTPTTTTTLTFTPLPTETLTPRPVVESLSASVTADRLSCRYGPGPEYLYLFAFRAGANIRLIGRVNADNWPWVLVENQVPCWVSTRYISISGNFLQLPAVYPEAAKLPITPYYPPSAVMSAERDPATNQVAISWMHVPVSLGDYEDDAMQTYIVELWRCQDGQLIFDAIGTRLTFLTFEDEPGCSEPSHGRVFVQEKHGYAGPAEIPWPEY